MIFDKVHLLFRIRIQIRIHNLKLRIRIRILQKVSDPYINIYAVNRILV
jgi:hypothetical protein